MEQGDDLLDEIIKKHSKSQTHPASGSPVNRQISADEVGTFLSGTVKKKVSTAVSENGGPSSLPGSEPVLNSQIDSTHPIGVPQELPNSPYIDRTQGPDAHSVALDRIGVARGVHEASGQPAPPSSKDKGIWDSIYQGSYLPAFNQGFSDLVIKPLAGATDFVDRTVDKAYTGLTGEPTPSWMRKGKDSVFDSLSKYYDEEYQKRNKPTNMASDIAEGVVGTLPLIASMATGEGEASLATKAPKFFTKITKVFAATKAASAYKKATEDNKDYMESLNEAAGGAAKGAVEGLTLEAQMLVAGALGKSVANKLAEKGLFAGGKAGKAILHALSVGTIFSGTSAGEDLLSGKDIDTNQAAKQFGMGLAFEAIPVAKGINDHLNDVSEGKDINDKAAQVATISSAAGNLNSESAIRTLINTPIDQVGKIHTDVPTSASTLYANSIEQGANAYDTKDPAEKRNFYANQLLLKTQADIKWIAKSLKSDSNLSDAIDYIQTSDELTPEQKTDLLDKINVLRPGAHEIAPATAEPIPQITPEDVQAIAPQTQPEPVADAQPEPVVEPHVAPVVEKAKEEVKPEEKPKPTVKSDDKAVDAVVYKPTSDIKTDTERFQPRGTDFSAESRDKIIKNFDDNKLDPIVVYKDSNGKDYVLAGHSRLAAHEALDKLPDSDPIKQKAIENGFKPGEIKARYFDGTEAQAKEFADRSNDLGTKNKDYESAASLRKMRDSGATRKDIDARAEEDFGKNARYIKNLSYLKPDGPVIDAMKQLGDTSDKAVRSSVEKIASWVGAARARFGDNLTNSHEREMFDFLKEAGNDKNLRTESEFLSRIGALVGTTDFDSSKPLNLNRIKNKSYGESVYENETNELKQAISEREETLDTLNDRLNNPKNPEYVKPTDAEYQKILSLADKRKQQINLELQSLRKEYMELQQNKSKYLTEGLTQQGLFDTGNLTTDETGELNDLLKEDGITIDDLKENEQSNNSGSAEQSGPDAEETKVVSEAVPKPANDKSGNENRDSNSEAIRRESGPDESSEPIKDKANSNTERAKEFADKIRAMKSDRNVLHGGLEGVAVGIYDGALETIASVIETGGKIADAIQAGLDYIKKNSESEESDYNIKLALHKDLSDLGIIDKGDLTAIIPKRSISTKEKLPSGPVEPAETADQGKKGKENYSLMGKMRDVRVRNLEQLKEFAEDVKNMDPYRAVKKYATSKSQSSIILKTATDRIVKEVGKPGWDKLRQALAESRLRGVRDRWANWGDDVLSKTDEEMQTIFSDGKDSKLYQIIGDLRGLEGEEHPEYIAAGLISNGNYAEARDYMAELLHQAADDVFSFGEFKDGTTFDEAVKDGKFVDPKMQKALEQYKEFIEKPIAESHESNEGVMSDAKGPLDTYYPLSPTGKDQHFVANSPTYKAPLNVNNKFTTGHSENYSTEISDLSNKLARSIRTNNKADAIKSLEKAGLIAKVEKSDKENGIINLNGEDFEAKKVKIADSKTITGSDGQPLHTPSRYVMMPNWLYSELKPIFEQETMHDEFSLFGRINNTLVKFQLGGPMEATGHSYRLLGGIVNSMPFMQEWAYKNGIVGKAGGLVLNNPFVKTILGAERILNTDITSEQAMKTIQEMSKMGIIPEKTWTKTWSKDFAELMGAKKVGFWDFSPVLYGKRSLDLKARVLMYNLSKAMNPEATPEQHGKMQYELGNYTQALQGQMERFVKHHGLAPFYSFSSAIYRAGIKSVLGSSPLPLERPTVKEMLTTSTGASKAGKLLGYKAAQLISTGIVGSVAYWATTYHAQTGKWPWDDKHSKLGKLPFPDWAKNDTNEKMYYDKKSRTWNDIDFFGFTNPFLSRGLRATGAPRAYETNQLGGTVGQSFEAGELQAINTNLSPYTNSPMIGGGVTALTGSAPYITSLRDDKGRPAVELYRKARTLPFMQQRVANIVVGAQSLNPIIDKGVDMVTNGLGLKSFKTTYSDEEQSAAGAFKFMLDIAFPRLTTKHGKDEMKSYFIHKEARTIKRTIKKEAKK